MAGQSTSSSSKYYKLTYRRTLLSIEKISIIEEIETCGVKVVVDCNGLAASTISVIKKNCQKIFRFWHEILDMLINTCMCIFHLLKLFYIHVCVHVPGHL